MDKRDFVVKMPKGARILSCQMQGEFPAIWALVNKQEPKEDRHFIAIGTGNEIGIPSPDKLKFIGTVQTGGGLVHHIFEH